MGKKKCTFQILKGKNQGKYCYEVHEYCKNKLHNCDDNGIDTNSNESISDTTSKQEQKVIIGNFVMDSLNESSNNKPEDKSSSTKSDISFIKPTDTNLSNKSTDKISAISSGKLAIKNNIGNKTGPRIISKSTIVYAKNDNVIVDNDEPIIKNTVDNQNKPNQPSSSTVHNYVIPLGNDPYMPASAKKQYSKLAKKKTQDLTMQNIIQVGPQVAKPMLYFNSQSLDLYQRKKDRDGVVNARVYLQNILKHANSRNKFTWLTDRNLIDPDKEQMPFELLHGKEFQIYIMNGPDKKILDDGTMLNKIGNDIMTISILKCINDEISAIDSTSTAENRFDPLYSGVFNNNIYDDLSKYTTTAANKPHLKQVIASVLGIESKI